MDVREIKEYVVSLFDKDKLAKLEDESGFFIDKLRDIKQIGYATNLTPETVNSAIEQNIDLIITHHDAWEFVYGMKEHCIEKLNEHSISHFFIHLPLDDCDFGTNVSFINELGAKILEKSSLQEDIFYCGRVGEFQKPLKFEDLVKRVEDTLEEKVKYWENNNREIRKICFVSGAGDSTKDIKDALKRNCDVYITGEKTLYTIQYAEFAGINLIVGSHTYTEIFGVESLCLKIKEKFNEIIIVRLFEHHKE